MRESLEMPFLRLWKDPISTSKIPFPLATLPTLGRSQIPGGDPEPAPTVLELVEVPPRPSACVCFQHFSSFFGVSLVLLEKLGKAHRRLPYYFKPQQLPFPFKLKVLNPVPEVRPFRKLACICFSPPGITPQFLQQSEERREAANSEY